MQYCKITFSLKRYYRKKGGGREKKTLEDRSIYDAILYNGVIGRGCGSETAKQPMKNRYESLFPFRGTRGGRENVTTD